MSEAEKRLIIQACRRLISKLEANDWLIDDTTELPDHCAKMHTIYLNRGLREEPPNGICIAFKLEGDVDARKVW